MFADDDDFPQIEEPTADFTYARLMRTQDKIETGYSSADLDGWAKTREGLGEARRRVRLFHLGRQSIAPRLPRRR